MADTRRPAERRPVFDTRASVLAAWFISIVAVWPILTFFVALACGLCVFLILAALYPESSAEVNSVVVGLDFGLPIFLVSPIVAAIASYKICRRVTAPWNEARPLAFEIDTVIVLLVALIAAFAFWALCGWLMQ